MQFSWAQSGARSSTRGSGHQIILERGSHTFVSIGHRACGNRACAAARPRDQVWRPWRCAAACRNAISRRARRGADSPAMPKANGPEEKRNFRPGEGKGGVVELQGKNVRFFLVGHRSTQGSKPYTKRLHYMHPDPPQRSSQCLMCNPASFAEYSELATNPPHLALLRVHVAAPFYHACRHAPLVSALHLEVVELARIRTRHQLWPVHRDAL